MIIASKTQRIIAASVDFIIVLLFYFLLVIYFGDKIQTEEGEIRWELNGLPALLFFISSFSYFVIPEALTGQTLGKALMNIKVVDYDGNSIFFKEAILRHLFDFVDWLPCFFIVFIIVMSRTEKHQRVGDIIAKTIVIKNKL